MKNDPELECRFWVASKLRPTGFEDYFYALDEAFVDRVDRDWKMLHVLLNRDSLSFNPVTVTNL